MQINPQIFRKTTTLYYEKEKNSYFWGSMSEQICKSRRRGGKYNGEGEKLLNLAMHKKTKITHFSQPKLCWVFLCYIHLGFQSRVRPTLASQHWITQLTDADIPSCPAEELKPFPIKNRNRVFLSFFSFLFFLKHIVPLRNINSFKMV